MVETNDDDKIIYELYEGLYGEGESTVPDVDNIVDYDLYIDAEVMLPKDGQHMQTARAVGQARGSSGHSMGTYNQNPILNKQVYAVVFPDGSIAQYAANIIAENIYSQIDEERHQLMDCILDHRKDGRAVPISEGYVISKNGSKSRRHTTTVLYFEVQWKDGMSSWVPLKELKESNLLQVAEYAETAEIINGPAFAWWAPHALKKRDNIISKVESRVKKKTHKFGVEVPRNVRSALELEKVNKNTLWGDVIQRKMSEV